MLVGWWIACSLPDHAPRPARIVRRIAHEVREAVREEDPGLDLPPVLAAGLAGRAPRSRPAVSGGPPVPLLVSPFTGIHASPAWFNHADSDDEPGQLAFTGQWVSGKHRHVAYDFLMPEGTPISAAADGLVVDARDHGPTTCPNTRPAVSNLVVKVFHPDAPDGNDYATIYYHLSRIDVREGQTVRVGDRIGLSGDTGCSTTPHLHFGVSRITNPAKMSGYAVDPYGWRGSGPDPLALRGHPSVYLWKEGEAPRLRRFGELDERHGTELVIDRFLALDVQSPVDGEFVEIVRPRRGPLRLAGYSLANVEGTRVPLPDLVLAPGERLRVWTGAPQAGERDLEDRPDTQEIGLGRAAQLWNDGGDCALLLDPSGELVSWMPFGRATGAREECRSAPVVELD